MWDELPIVTSQSHRVHLRGYSPTAQGEPQIVHLPLSNHALLQAGSKSSLLQGLQHCAYPLHRLCSGVSVDDHLILVENSICSIGMQQAGAPNQGIFSLDSGDKEICQ